MPTLTPQDRIFLNTIVEKKILLSSAIEKCLETMRNHQQHGLENIRFTQICVDLKVLTKEQVQEIEKCICEKKNCATDATQVKNLATWTTKDIQVDKDLLPPPQLLETQKLPQPRPTANFVIDKYKVFTEVGRGGMGIVYKAVDQDLQREVAIKVIKKRQSTVEEKRFLREMKVTATLDHPNIVGVYSGGNFNGNLYIVMPFISGLPLDEYVHYKKLSLRRKLKIIAQLAEALEYAHQQKIIHRDIKPSNVIIDNNDVPKLTDFGLAKTLSSEEALITQSGEVVGTPIYMPPERITGSKPLSTQDDIYSLGAILYEIIAMRPMISGKTPLLVLYNIQHKRAVALRKINTRIPIEVEYIWKKCVAPVGERYSSMNELQQDINNFLYKKTAQNKYKKPRLSFPVVVAAFVGFLCLFFVLIENYGKADKYPVTSLEVTDAKTNAKTSINHFNNFLRFGMYKQAIELFENLFNKSDLESEQKNAMAKKILLNAHKMNTDISTSLLEKYYKFIENVDIDIDLAVTKYYFFHQNYIKVNKCLLKLKQYTLISEEQQSESDYYRGRLLFLGKKWQEAYDLFFSAMKIQSSVYNEAVLYTFMCSVELESHQFSFSQIEFIEKQFTKNPLFFEYCGRFFLLKRQWKKALEYFSESLKLRPSNSYCHTYHAQCYMNLDNFESAFTHIKLALDKESHNFDNINTLNTVSSLILKYPEEQFHILKLIHGYVGKLFSVKKPQLYADDIRERRRLFKSSYDEYHKLLQQPFSRQRTKTLLKSLNQKRGGVSNTAYNGLLSLRHHSGFLIYLEKLQPNYPKATQKILASFLQNTSLLVKEERTNVYNYLMAKLHLDNDEQTREELLLVKDNIKDILQDSHEDVLTRYLAGRTLIQIGYWESVYDLCATKNTTSIISLSALYDQQFRPELPDLSNLESYWNDDQVLLLFLQSILQKTSVSKNVLVFLEKALKHPSFSVRILAAIGFDKWSHLESPQATEIMQKNIFHDNFIIRYLVNYYFWQSNVVRKQPEKFMKVYQKMLGDFQNPNIISLIMLAPRELHKDQIKLFSQAFDKFNDQPIAIKIAMFMRTLNDNEKIIKNIMASKIGMKYNFMRTILYVAPMVNNISSSLRLLREQKILAASQVLSGIKSDAYKLQKGILKEKNAEVRAAIRCFCSWFDHYGVEYLGKDLESTNHILINLCYKKIERYKSENQNAFLEGFMNAQKPLTQEEQNTIKRFIYHENTTVSKATLLTSIIFEKNGLQKQLQKIRQKQHSLSDDKKKLYAETLYAYVRLQILKSLPFVTKFYNFGNEEQQALYIQQLREIVRNKNYSATYKNLLDFAIELNDCAKYRYLRSVIYAEKGLFEESRKDLLKITEFNQSYYVDLAVIAKHYNETTKIAEYLEKIDFYGLSHYDVIKVVDLYKSISEVDKVKLLLKQFLVKRKTRICLSLLKGFYSKKEEKYIAQLNSIIDSKE
ncbi:protein kinase [Candidatus Uabimicrobium sp. HlEnr_7]|uniref:serine/threonine protein kinase n=1 Tax=Candidatus Uabimicrobium helgolandensis TaxID=3095367 RepID=UPI0035577BB7